MSGLIQTLAGGHAAPQQVTGSVVQSSLYGIPIPVIYGLCRTGANLIHLPHDPVKSSANGGGKFGHTKATSPDTYTAPVMLAICEGPVNSLNLGRIWADKDLVSNGIAYAAAGWDFSHDGSPGQLPWSYLTTNVPGQAVSYPGLFYVANASIDLPGYHLRNYSFEVVGLLPFGGGIVDASPADVLLDILTNVQYGYGWTAPGGFFSLLPVWSDWIDYCAAAGLFVSPNYASQRTGIEAFDELAEASNTAAVWSDGLLKMIPYGDKPLSGNGHTFTPNTAPVYDLTDVDFMPGLGEDPVRCERKANADAYNQVFVEFEDRQNEYNPSTAEAKDELAIFTLAAQNHDTGLRPAPKVALPLIKDMLVARQVAQLRLQREQSVRNLYYFRLGVRFSLLEPMDLVTLTDIGLGLFFTPVRIVEVTEQPGEQGIDFIAEDWPFGSATATQYPTASGIGYSTQGTIAPGHTVATIFDGPQPLASSPLEIWIAASGGAVWGGCEIWYSADNVQYYKIGILNQRATFGTLTAALAVASRLPAVDSTHTLAVDVTNSGGSLVSVSATDFAALTSLCYVDGEFLAFQTAALTSAFHYNLTTLGRGAYTSPIANHAIGTAFVLCDQAVYRLPFPQGKLGQTIFFKFPAFNQYGGALENIATLTPVSFVIGSIPGEPTVGLTARIGATSSTSVRYDVTVTNTSDPGSGASQLFTLHIDPQAVVVTPTADQTATLAPGASFTVSYTFDRGPVAGSQAAANWVASAPGWNSAYWNADISTQTQDASQIVAISIDDVGTAVARFNWASNQLSGRYASASGVSPATPSDASALAGTSVVGRVSSAVVAVGMLLGDTVIVKAVPFTDAGGTTQPGQIVTVAATRQNKNTTGKPLAVSGSLFRPDDNTQLFFSGGGVINTGFTAVGNNDTLDGEIPLQLADGITITEFDSVTFRTQSGAGAAATISLIARDRTSFTTTTLALQSNSTSGVAQTIQTTSIGHVVNNTLYVYYVRVHLASGTEGAGPPLNDFSRLFGVVVYYTSPDYTKSI